MITKEKLNLIFELMYEFKNYSLRESEIREIIDNAFPIPSILNELVTKNLLTYNTTTHTYKYNDSKEAQDHLKSLTKV